MSDTFSIKRDGTVWYGKDAGTPGKWAWSQIGWVEKDGRRWRAYGHDWNGAKYLIASNCPTRHEGLMAIRWPDDVPQEYQ